MFSSDLAFVRSDLVGLLVFFIVFSDCARSGKGNGSERFWNLFSQAPGKPVDNRGHV